MNIVDTILASCTMKTIKEWMESEEVFEKGTILVGITSRFRTEPFNPENYKFKVSDGIHAWKDIPLSETQKSGNHQIAIMQTSLEDNINPDMVLCKSQLVCVMDRQGHRKFKIGDGISPWCTLGYIERVEDFPIGFVI